GECRNNHEVVVALAKRLGAEHPGFEMSPRDLIDWTLQKSGYGTIDDLEEKKWLDVQPGFEEAHFLNGFGYRDRKFRFSPDWPSVPYANAGHAGPWDRMPKLPDHWNVIEEATEDHPFRLATSPSRSFLNSTFAETPTGAAREKRPEVMMHPEDASQLGVADGDQVELFNERGEVRLHVRLFDGVRRGVLIAEGVWPNSSHHEGRGINTLTGADAVAPYGGAAFHDNHVQVRRV
ncbi:MAG: molybdopterin dinucleotide binding domain-containing protein, partial [Microvirga sp.]